MAQKELAIAALGYAEDVEQAQAYIATAGSCPGIISLKVLENAKSTVVDKGALWRRETDNIAGNIARSLPTTRLGRLMLGSGIFYTDDKKLYEDDLVDRRVRVYNSLPSTNELRAGITIADKERWQNLLFHIRIDRL